MVNQEEHVNVTPWRRTHIILPATAGIQLSTVEQLARGHTFDAEGRRRLTQASKRPTDYEPDYKYKKYTEGKIHINMDMQKNKLIRDFTTQDQVGHMLGVALAQVHSLKKRLKEICQNG